MPQPQKSFQKIASFALDVLFPHLCFGCGKSGALLCGVCERRVPLINRQCCFVCQKNQTRYGEKCFACANNENPLDAVFAAVCYQVPIIKKMIHAFKYQFVRSFEPYLGNIFAKAIEQSSLPLPSHIVPVPLHKKRLRYRGFNQSETLAQELINSIDALRNTKAALALIRTRDTKPQQKTSSKEERLANLQSAFQFTETEHLQDAVIWLVDDVATTTSTLTECATVLKHAGAKKVYGVVLARD